jgi:hypothetical protein
MRPPCCDGGQGPRHGKALARVTRPTRGMPDLEPNLAASLARANLLALYVVEHHIHNHQCQNTLQEHAACQHK